LVGFACTDAKWATIIAYGDVPVYENYPSSGPPMQKQIIATLVQGNVSEVIQERYSKDFMYYKIKLSDGRKGYVWVGDKFNVVAKQGRK
jgi:hypothetical protein